MTALRWTLLLLVAGACGCGRGPEFAPVEGAITRGGRPLTKVEVLFYADGDTRGPLAAGLTDDQGRYRLRTETGADGAVVGRYRVCVNDRSVMPGFGMPIPVAPGVAKSLPPEIAKPHKQADGKKAATPRIPPQYSRFAETPLRAEVTPGGSTIDLQIP